MSNLGFQSMYGSFNAFAECVCERAFLPDRDELKFYKEDEQKLLSLESQSPLSDFDVIAFSLPFEEDYVNAIRILNLSGISPLHLDRAEEGPLIIGGGCGVSLNPEPLADILDAVFIGEAEGSVGELVRIFGDTQGLSRGETLKEIVKVPGIYVPSFYGYEYIGERVKSIKVKESAPTNAPLPVKRVRAMGEALRLVPESVIITKNTEFSSTHLIEVERGCPRGCRFCTAGFMYLPPRWRDLSDVLKSVDRGGERCTKIGLIGAAVSEYPYIKEVIRAIHDKGLEVTLSSLRLDVLDTEFLTLLKASGYKTITVAPEAGSERLRRVINKDMTDELILEKIALIREAGFTKVKLYFMVGLPTETDSDALAIASLTGRISETLQKGKVSVSVNPFVPKPVTPFQWHGMEDATVIDARFDIIKSALKGVRGVELRTYPSKESLAQAYISRADRRIGSVLVEAALTSLKRALKKHAPEYAREAARMRASVECLAWDVIDHGILKKYLWLEYERALGSKATPPCDMPTCKRCGVC